MLSDHQNLLSTFGKDSQSSNRNSREHLNSFKNKPISLIYDFEPKSRYEQILSQRKTLMLLQKAQQSSTKQKKTNRKLKTQTDIDYLNTRIRKSISGIAESICKSKIRSDLTSKQIIHQSKSSSVKKLSQITRQSIQSQVNLKIQGVKKKRLSFHQKENFNYNNIQESKRGNIQSKRNLEKNLNKKEYLKNSTTKKGVFFNEQNQCQIKSSFSIDLNSQSSRVLQSSRKQIFGRKFSREHLSNAFSDIQNKYIGTFNQKQKVKISQKIKQLTIGKQMEQTLKKQFKQLSEQQLDSQFKFLETKGNRNQKYEQKFLFYQDLNTNEDGKTPGFNKIQFSKDFKVKKTQLQFPNKKYHKLIQQLMKQIQLDYDLRHAKHMFSGIQQPFYAHSNDINSQYKWQRLNGQLQQIGLHYSVQTIKKIFLPTQQEIDPFLSVGKPHQELIYSLIYAYQAAEIHWEQEIYQHWQHWDLRDIQLTIQNIDRDRKGYITTEDIAAFIGMQTGKQYKNRDVILIYKRLINGFSSRRSQELSSIYGQHKQRTKLKFRALIDCLIKPFSHSKSINAQA